MSGTRAGGLKASATNKSKLGADFYARIGAKGGKVAPGPFLADRELARRAGKLGGTISKRGVKSPPQDTFFVKDETIDTNVIIEPFVKGRFWQGWIKRSNDD